MCRYIINEINTKLDIIGKLNLTNQIVYVNILTCKFVQKIDSRETRTKSYEVQLYL